jgi:hypothetical protein
MNNRLRKAILNSYNLIFDAFERRNEANGNKNYLNDVGHAAALIGKAMESGDFVDSFAIICAMQEYDYSFLA